MQNLCFRRDQLFRELNDMKLPVEQFKRFDRYFVTEKVSASSKEKPKKKSRGEKRKMTEQLKPFPKELGQKLISNVVKEMDKGIDKFQFEDDTRLQRLYEP